jgi:hypothetical protein
MIDRVMPRGIRNNNPGNIRLTSTRWLGQKEAQFDNAFVEFSDPVYGLRALMKVLLTYYRKYGLDTVQSVINRWAPPSENATDHYAAHVAHRLKVKRTEQIRIDDCTVLKSLARAIVIHENGWPPKHIPKGWYAEKIYSKAADLALKQRSFA